MENMQLQNRQLKYQAKLPEEINRDLQNKMLTFSQTQQLMRQGIGENRKSFRVHENQGISNPQNYQSHVDQTFGGSQQSSQGTQNNFLNKNREVIFENSTNHMTSGVDGHSTMLSPKSQMLDNIVSILSHKSIKNKKEYLQRYAFNKKDSSGCKSLLNTMNKLIQSKVTLANTPSNGKQLNLTMIPSQNFGMKLRQASPEDDIVIKDGKQIPRAQSVNVKHRRQKSQVRQKSNLFDLIVQGESSGGLSSTSLGRPFALQQRKTLSIAQTPSSNIQTYKIQGPHLRTPPLLNDAQNHLAFMLSTQKKQICEINSKKSLQQNVQKKQGDLRNYSPEDHVKVRRDQDKKTTFMIPSNIQNDPRRHKDDLSQHSSQLYAPSEVTEKQYLYRQNNLDSTRPMTTQHQPSPLQMTMPMKWSDLALDYKQYKSGTPAINRQYDVETHKEDILKIQKTQIRTVKAVPYRGNNMQQASIDAFEERKGKHQNNASSQKSINEKYTDGDLEAVMNQYNGALNRNQFDNPPHNSSIESNIPNQRKSASPLTPSPQKKQPPNAMVDDYLLSRLPSFGAGLNGSNTKLPSPAKYPNQHQSSLMGAWQNNNQDFRFSNDQSFELLHKGGGLRSKQGSVHKQDSETQTPTHNREEEDPSQIMQNVRFQVNQMLDEGGHSDLRDPMESILVELAPPSNQLPLEHQQSDQFAQIEGLDRMNSPQSDSNPEELSLPSKLPRSSQQSNNQASNGDNTPSFNNARRSLSRGKLSSQLGQGSQYQLNPSYYYSKNGGGARMYQDFYKLNGSPTKIRQGQQVLNEDISRVASISNLRKRKPAIPSQNIKMVQIKTSDRPQVLDDYEIEGAENIKIDILSQQYKDQQNSSQIQQFNNNTEVLSKTSDRLLQEEIALMNDGTILLTALSNKKLCKFSSTLAYQQKFMRAKTLPRKDFQIPVEENHCRPSSPQSIGRNTQHTLLNFTNERQNINKRHRSPSPGSQDQQREFLTHNSLPSKATGPTSNPYKRQQFIKRQQVMQKEKEQLKQLRAVINERKAQNPKTVNNSRPASPIQERLDSSQMNHIIDSQQYIRQVKVFIQNTSSKGSLRPQSSGGAANNPKVQRKPRLASAQSAVSGQFIRVPTMN